MKFKLDEIKLICNVLGKFVATSDTIPFLKNICFDGDKATAFNGMSACTVPFVVEEPFIVPFHRFNVFVQKAKVDIGYSLKDGNLTLESGNSKAIIPIDEDIECFPAFDALVGKEKIENVFNQMKVCLPFVGKNISNYALTGVYFDGLGLIATDGMKIASYAFPGLIDPINFQCIIPSDFIRLLPGADSMSMADDKIVIEYEGFTMISNAIDADYPDVLKFFPENIEMLDLPKKEMLSIVKGVYEFSEEDREVAKCTVSIDKEIEVKFAGKTAHISEFLDFGGKVGKKKFTVNPYLFSELLKYCDEFAITDTVLYGNSKDGLFEAMISVRET